MPNRIIKENICYSSTIEKLTPEEEIFFYRLIVQCDDFGLFDARAAILRSKLYPLKVDELGLPTVSLAQIESWKRKLSSKEVNLIRVYSVGDREYLKLTTWEQHQQVRAKYPKFPQECCNQLQSDASKDTHKQEEPPNPNANMLEIFSYWNSKEIQSHKAVTSDIEKNAKAALKSSSVEEIKQAIETYATVIKSDEYYFKYTWTLAEFLKRGLEKFKNRELAFKNYSKGGKTKFGTGTQKRGTDNTRPPERGSYTEPDSRSQ